MGSTLVPRMAKTHRGSTYLFTDGLAGRLRCCGWGQSAQLLFLSLLLGIVSVGSTAGVPGFVLGSFANRLPQTNSQRSSKLFFHVVSDNFIRARPQARCRSKPRCRSAAVQEEDARENRIVSHDHEPSSATTSPGDVSLSLLVQDFARDMDALSQLRPNDPWQDPSAAYALISAGSSYTRLWTPDTWRRHAGPPPHARYFRHAFTRWPFSTTARIILPSVLLSVAWSGLVAFAVRQQPRRCWSSFFQVVVQSGSATTAVTLLSAPLALLLTLRANQSMQRLLEARLAWGQLVLHCRTLANQAKLYLMPTAPRATLLLARHLALCGWILKAYVRGESRETQIQALSTVLRGDDLQWILAQPKYMDALLARVRQIIYSILQQQQQQQGTASVVHSSSIHLILEERLVGLSLVSGQCERLLSSPIPPTYSRHLSRAICLWLGFLPLAAAATTTAHVVPLLLATAAISYIIIGIDEVGMEIEPCFPLLPLQQLAAAAQTSICTAFVVHSHDTEQQYAANDMPLVPGM